MKKYDVLPHTADFKIRAYGNTVAELFANTCIGMFSGVGFQSEFCTKKNDEIVCTDMPIQHEIKITASEREILLVDFLSEALYLSDVHNEAYLAVDIHTFSDISLHATVRGVPVTRFDLEIKAVTFHDLSIKKTDKDWQAEVVFDI